MSLCFLLSPHLTFSCAEAKLPLLLGVNIIDYENLKKFLPSSFVPRSGDLDFLPQSFLSLPNFLIIENGCHEMVGREIFPHTRPLKKLFSFGSGVSNVVPGSKN